MPACALADMDLAGTTAKDGNGAAPKEALPTVLHTRVVSGTGGGPEKTILNSPRFLERHGYRAICAYMHPPDDPGFADLLLRAETYGARLESIPDRGPLDWRVVRDHLRLCRRENVTIWHGHDYKSNLLGLMLRPFWKMHLVTTVHGWVKRTRRTPLYYWIDRLCLPRYERVICVSADLYETCVAAGTSKERLCVVDNAIDTDEYSRTLPAPEAKRRLGFDPDRFLVGAVGRLSDEKAFDVLIRAVHQLATSGNNVGLVIVGEGDERPRLEALIGELGMQERIRLLGHRSDVIALYQVMDVFALSSVREGLPNVLLEAMALEVPVVATRIAGVPRLMSEGTNGLLVEPHDVSGLAHALTQLVTDAALRAKLARAGRQTVLERFTFAERMKKIVAIYDGMLSNRLPAS